MIATGVISDRGDLYLPGCIESLNAACTIVPRWVIDDREHRLGMAGAVAASWQLALDDPNVDYLLHVEEDFRFSELPVWDMRRILESNPDLAQVVLKRQPWSAEEHAAGGQLEVAPGDFTDCTDGELHWVEHERLFSLNPCLIPRRTLELGAPVDAPGGFEAAFTERCLAAGLRFAYFGRREDPPRCEHVGHRRGGDGWRW